VQDQAQLVAAQGLLPASLVHLGTDVVVEHAWPQEANVATGMMGMITLSQRGLHAQKRQFTAPIPMETNSNVPPTTPVVETCVQDRGQCAATQELLQVSLAPLGTHVAATHARPQEVGVAGAGV